ncbi:MAG: hypothetical protein A2Z34_07265 [Planctomycetes bacterium RBG_16_59_8]|nr:MAG: hypothetical protein A2Z34_07265 [Planctomycetes bacterium RBG_16_59_8]
MGARAAVMIAALISISFARDPKQSDGTCDSIKQEKEGVRLLIEALGDDDPEKREWATDKLIEMGKEIVPQVRTALSIDDPEVRFRAQRVLDIIAVRDRVVLSGSLLKNCPQIYKELAGVSFERKLDIFHKIIEVDGSRKSLCGATDDDITAVVGELILSGEKELSRDCKETICFVCNGGRPLTIEEIPEGYMRFGHAKLPALLPKIETFLDDRDICELAFDTIVDVARRKAIPTVMRVLEHEEKEMRLNAIAAVERLKMRDATTRLIGLLGDDDRSVRREAMYVLGELRPVESTKEIRRMLMDEDPLIRRTAVNFFAFWRIKEAVGDIRKLLKDREEEVCVGAIRALARLEAKEAIPDVRELLQSPSESIQSAALGFLGKMGAKDIAPHLVKLMGSGDDRVQYAAVSGLGEIGAVEALPGIMELIEKWKKEGHPPWFAPTLRKLCGKEDAPRLMSLLDHPNKWVRLEIAGVLGDIGIRESGSKIVDILKDEDGYARTHPAVAALDKLKARETIPAIMNILNDERMGIKGRGNAALALGKLGATEAIPSIIALFKRSDDAIVNELCDAVIALNATETVPEIIKLIERGGRVSERAAMTLGWLGAKETAPRLRNLLANIDGDIRGGAAYALGLLGAREAIPDLMLSLEDEEDTVRGRAALALGKLQAREAMPALKELLYDREIWVRGTAVTALVEMGEKDTLPDGVIHDIKALFDTEYWFGNIEDQDGADALRRLGVCEAEITTLMRDSSE